MQMYFNNLERSFTFQLPVYQDARIIMLENDLKSVLDIGCNNPQKLAAYLWPFTDDITGIDIPEVVENIKEPFGEWLGCDLEKEIINLGRMVDLIIAADVVEHLKEAKNFFEVVRLHAHKDTVIIISTPEKNIINGVNLSHEHDYTKEEMEKMIKENGLTIIGTRQYVEKNASYPYTENVFICKVER
jgi:predicted TPR repeat methyltransferase